MKILLLLTFALLIPIGMSAQTAKVQALTPAEAAEAKSLYQQKADIDKKISDFRDGLVKEYIEVAYPKDAAKANGSSYIYFNGHGEYSYRVGWNNDSFLFSDDFKYIVPAPAQTSSPGICIGGSCGSTIVTPAYFNNGAAIAN